MSIPQAQSTQLDLPHLPQPVFHVNYSDQITDSKIRALIEACSEILATVVPIFSLCSICCAHPQ
jgi:hypothetical protein